MPSRVVREHLLSSRSLSRVSEKAEILFVHLILVVDDYGRFDARPEVVVAACFPTRREISLKDVAQRLDELCSEGCVERYSVDGDWYIRLSGWEKHRGSSKRAQTSKYPKPQASGDSPDPREIPGSPGYPSGSRESGVGGMESGVVTVGRSPGKPSTGSSADPSALRLSELLIELLREVPGATIPRGSRSRWAREIEALVRQAPELATNGSGPWEHIEAAIRWALGPDNLGREFEVVIRSGKSLREKWPSLVAAARRHQRREKSPYEEIDRWMNSAT